MWPTPRVEVAVITDRSRCIAELASARSLVSTRLEQTLDRTTPVACSLTARPNEQQRLPSRDGFELFFIGRPTSDCADGW
jgi:hypothetical protein